MRGHKLVTMRTRISNQSQVLAMNRGCAEEEPVVEQDRYGVVAGLGASPLGASDPRPLHAHLGQLAQPSRTVPCTFTEKTTSPEQLPLHPELETAIFDYLQPHNAVHRPSVWTKSAHQSLDSIAHYRRRTNDLGH